MMRSMFAGVSGLRNHQTRMDVIGNNIANVNTVGYKKGRVTFQDMLSQNIRGAASPQGGRGGTNPQQIGLGMAVNSIDTIWTPGSAESTGKATDMMITGDGFFIVGDGSNKYYTRAGNFDFDAAGSFITPAGLKVQGWMADSAGVIDTTQSIGDIQIPKGTAIKPQATTEMAINGNLDANAAVNDTITVPTEVYDSLGRSYNLNLTFTKTAANAWTVSLPATLPTGWSGAGLTNTALTFNGSGSLTSASTITLTSTVADAANLSAVIDISGLTQYAAQESDVKMDNQDGYSSGVLNGYSIDSTGVITGWFSNGFSQKLGQVALANFNNPAGLTKAGENLYIESNNSGRAQEGTAGTGGRGTVSPGQLEMSNVDLSQEFTDMIITQRGFQANSRIITVSDEMLQELVNLKR